MLVVRRMRRLNAKWVLVTVVDDRLRVRSGAVRFVDTAEPRLTPALERLFPEE